MVRTILLIALFGWLPACSDGTGGPDLLSDQTHDVAALKRLPLPTIDTTTPVRPGSPRRVVSFIPSVTELIFTLGVGDRLVGRSHWCDWPEEALRAPSLGTLQAVSKEAIVDLRPDLVILFRSQADLARSLRRDFGVNVVTPATETSAEIFEGIATVSDALGVPERGRALIRTVKEQLEEVRTRNAGRPKPRVLIVLDRSSWFVPGKTSFVHELMEVAGAHNVAAQVDSPQAWPSVTLEQIVDWKPEVILDLSIGADSAQGRRAAAAFWEDRTYIPAVSSRRVLFLEAGVLVRPGPRMAAVAAVLAEMIHG